MNDTVRWVGHSKSAASVVIAALLAMISLLPWPGDRVGAESLGSSKFKEVGRIPVVAEDPAFTVDHNSGWLIISPRTRRAYTILESGSHTIIRSFDLDTLRPRVKAKVAGVPIPGGSGFEGGTNTVVDAELVHAVDSVAGRIYLPMSSSLPHPSTLQPDTQRSFQASYVLVIDEAAFDAGRPAFGALAPPSEHAHLLSYYLMGLTVTRHHVAADAPGKLVALFAAPYRPTAPTDRPGLYDHTLVQWDPSGVRTDKMASEVRNASEGGLAGATQARAEWSHVLGVCATAPLTSQVVNLSNNYQRGILVASDAVYTGCQAAPEVGAVARVALDGDGTAAPHLAGERLFRLVKPIADAVADNNGGRLFVRTFGGPSSPGATWWVFDGATERYSGSIAASTNDGAMAVGVDPGSGRFWTLTPDTCVRGSVPVRGGIKFVEAGLDPVPAALNVAPELAYPAMWGIQVDPVTRRVFVRRGWSTGPSLRHVYPSCDDAKRVPAPQELFYRVFEDRTPVAQRPEGLDDSSFTTNTPEAEGLTQASYLGAGSGYGARLVLTGGIDAASGGVASALRSPCGRDDRELLSGAVGKVEVSDQSTAAEAAGLDADGHTVEATGNPLNRCRSQAPSEVPTYQTLNRCHRVSNGELDTEEAAFDEKTEVSGKTIDQNGDGCDDRDGSNRYAARCLGAEGAKSPEGFASEKTIPRDGFAASVTCDATRDRAEGAAQGAVGLADLDKATGTTADPLRVGQASSTVRISRTLGKGITVNVDSWARAIDIPGVGSIGMVRSEATSTATGRDGRAEGRYERTICDVRLPDRRFTGCLGDGGMQRAAVKALNDALGGQGEVRLRTPDHELIEGTDHGYLAAVQRDRKELFNDQVITRDRSLTVPGLEIILYQGDGGAWGAGRQVLQLAGVQASTSYGIACLYGIGVGGKCARDSEFGVGGAEDLGLSGPGEPEVVAVVEEVPYEVPADDGGDDAGGGVLQRIVQMVRRVPEAVFETARLAFNDPRELGLLAAVWGLLFAPCWLGERRRSIAGLRARRASRI